MVEREKGREVSSALLPICFATMTVTVTVTVTVLHIFGLWSKPQSSLAKSPSAQDAAFAHPTKSNLVKAVMRSYSLPRRKF